MLSTFEKDKAYNIEIRGKKMRILIVRSFPDILLLLQPFCAILKKKAGKEAYIPWITPKLSFFNA